MSKIRTLEYMSLPYCLCRCVIVGTVDTPNNPITVGKQYVFPSLSHYARTKRSWNLAVSGMS